MINIMNKKEKELFIEFWQKRAAIQDEMIWVGCNPGNPQLYKKQREEGFALMGKMNRLAREYLEKIEKAKHERCERCNGTGKINARIPYSMIPDVGNCSFKEDCPDCKNETKSLNIEND